MKTKLTILAALLLASVYSNAQTIRWIVKPNYTSIEYFSNDIFKCIDQNGKVQLVDWNGKSLLPENVVDNVTEYADGYSIALQGNKILGFLTEAKPHAFITVNGEYCISEYPFFSEGFLVVVDSKGKMGYMNTDGQIAIECKYEKARPFRMGRASVEPAKKQVFYINPQGKTNNPDSFHGGKLTKGSSFNENGEAVVANYQDYAVIGTNMKVKRKIEYTADLPVRLCDFAYSANVGDCFQDNLLIIDYDKNIEVDSKEGRFGYRWDVGLKNVEIPAQFSEADYFYNDRAIAAKGSKFGILELLGGHFESNWPVNNLRVYSDGFDMMQFTLKAPASLESNKIKLEFDKGDGRFVDCDGLRYDFKVAEQVTGRKEKKCILHAKATYIESDDELLLWEGTQELGIDYISINLSSPTVVSEYADENNNQTVKAVVTNTSDVTVKVSATLNVGGKTSPFNGELKPNQSKTLTVTVQVDEDRKVQASVSAKVDGHNGGNKSSTVSLKKI